MSEITTQTTIENYKGILQQYCHARNLRDPGYEIIQQGRPDAPTWMVTVKYGQSTYTTPEPIQGSKKLAEQMAAKRILEAIESRQEAFLAGKPLDETIDSAESHEVVAEVLLTENESPSAEPLYVPVELVTTALGIANHRLSTSRGGTRYREPMESKQASQAFAQNLADLTMRIVREVTTAAEKANIKFGHPK
jgi:hypothetical protein